MRSLQAGVELCGLTPFRSSPCLKVIKQWDNKPTTQAMLKGWKPPCRAKRVFGNMTTKAASHIVKVVDALQLSSLRTVEEKQRGSDAMLCIYKDAEANDLLFGSGRRYCVLC